MNQFSTQLNQRLHDVQEAKEFAHSPQIKRIEKIAPFEGGQDAAAILIGFVSAAFMIFLFGSFVNEVFGDFVAGCVATALLCAALVFGCVTELWVPYHMKRWRNKAKKLGLNTSQLYNPEDFKWFTQTMSASSQIEVINQCEKAGATPQQLKRLYELTADNLPCVWWNDLCGDARHACMEQDKKREQDAVCIARANAEHADREEIARKLQQDAQHAVKNTVTPIVNFIKV